MGVLAFSIVAEGADVESAFQSARDRTFATDPAAGGVAACARYQVIDFGKGENGPLESWVAYAVARALAEAEFRGLGPPYPAAGAIPVEGGRFLFFGWRK